MGLGTLLFLGLVQGLTEFLPVSSSGHLALAKAWLGGREAGGAFVEIALHAGTLAAVLALYRADWMRLARGGAALVRGPAEGARGEERRGLLLLAVGTLPAVVVGLAFRRRIEALFDFPRAVGLALLGTAALLALGSRAARRARRPFEEIGFADAAWIGLAQACALVPGLSRSGLTIAAALGRGIEPTSAARYSFLLSVPVTAGACLLEAIDWGRGEVGAGAGALPLLAAIAVSGIVGAASIRVLLRLLRRGRLDWFAAWCAALGALALILPPLKDASG